MSFVVAFNGARDAYQVPLALQEKSLLTKLVTDIYLPDLVTELVQHIPRISKLRNRHVNGLPIWKVKSSLELIKLQYLEPILVQSGLVNENSIRSSHRGQAILSLLAIETAYQTNSNLLLYAGYAYEAFRSPKSKGKIKGVFQYHPHIKLCSEILRKDLEKYPQLNHSIENLKEDEKDPTNIEELSQADLIICASSFTARSLEYIGISSKKIAIIPYGINFEFNKPKSNFYRLKNNDTCRFIFVGSGIHRKGLHHLFEAWSKLNITNAHLTVVARKIDNEIAKLKPDGVELLPAQSHKQLQELYEKSHVFVLPSLIEGFGYVYLEALSHGCFCIGTENTGLPDIACPDDVGYIATAGELDSLIDGLTKAYNFFKDDHIDPIKIKQFATTKKWEYFRKSLADLCWQVEKKQ